jgi:hypothetical protein
MSAALLPRMGQRQHNAKQSAHPYEGNKQQEEFIA